MEAGAIFMLIIFALILIGGLTFCFLQTGKGKWED
ncbi:MAG: MetS family NSS transporter small subunit [Desulfobacterales bacterium]|nr:MetS family NSS transporter small subunit [Desulfobacterales bacterium]MBS3810096.1 MetS family NSS transporter small subunit [Desulfobacterales bacterium]